MKNYKKSYRLPNDKFTYDVNKYIKAWRDFSRPICKATDSVLHAFDPSIQIRVGEEKGTMGIVVSLPNLFIEKFNAYYGLAEELKKSIEFKNRIKE